MNTATLPTTLEFKENKTSNFFSRIFTFRANLSDKERTISQTVEKLIFESCTAINTKHVSTGFVSILHNSEKDIIVMFDEHNKTLKMSKELFVHDVKMSSELCSSIKVMIKDESNRRFEEAIARIDEKIMFNLEEIESKFKS